MATKVSFNKFENDLIHHYRNQISGAESSSDVMKFFDYAVRELCNKIFDGNVSLKSQDFQVGTESDAPYQVHHRLLATDAFSEVWNNSDLPHIVERFAQTAIHRAIHLSKHREKTNLKIRR